MNYNFANRGTLYLLDTIELICCANNSKELMENIERKVYTQIAKKYNKNPLTIKSNIIKATNNMYNFNVLVNNDLKKHIKYTPKFVIYNIVDKIKDKKIIEA